VIDREKKLTLPIPLTVFAGLFENNFLLVVWEKSSEKSDGMGGGQLHRPGGLHDADSARSAETHEVCLLVAGG